MQRFIERFHIFFAAVGIVATGCVLLYFLRHSIFVSHSYVRDQVALITQDETTPTPSVVDGAWVYTFNEPGVLNETAESARSPSPYWWLNSGGRLDIKDDIGMTIHKALPRNDAWVWRYQRSNPVDTDDGRYPQNLFRLVSKRTAGDADVSFAFRIDALNMIDSPNRDAWSGIFIMSRYHDGDNLYYGGLRQNGDAVIKKKINGTYYTLAEKPVFLGSMPYNKYTFPNLIPGHTWMRLKMRTLATDGEMHITLFLDRENNGTWEEVLRADDTQIGGAILDGEARIGVRGDFMDFSLDDITIDTTSVVSTTSAATNTENRP